MFLEIRDGKQRIVCLCALLARVQYMPIQISLSRKVLPAYAFESGSFMLISFMLHELVKAFELLCTFETNMP